MALASNNTQANIPSPPPATGDTDKVRPVTEQDHIRGNPDADITIVEYSDFECPFCKRIHPTLGKIVESDSDVRWVYRHFPLDSLHPKNARKAAVAAECAGKLGGNDAFWQFTDNYYATTPANDIWNIDEQLENLLSGTSIDIAAFNTCYTSGEFDDHVQSDVDNAVETGGRGTPWSIIITKSGNTIPINGALPEESIRQLLDLARQN
jgi:protein-disulfide isomerase